MSKPAIHILRASFVALVACGGGGGTGPISADEAEGTCRDVCQRDADCGELSETVDQCTADCVAEVSTGWLRADAFEAIGACAVDLACGADDDVCLRECSPTSAHERYESQCRTVFASCGTDPDQLNRICETTPMPGVDGDDLGFFCLVTPAIMEEMLDCIPDGTSCQAGATCIQAVAASHDLDV